MASSSTPQNLKRITQELSRLHAESLPPFLSSLSPISDDDLTTWTAVLLGPKDTIYSSGRWRLHITIPSTYPMKPPTIKFQTRIAHANIDWNTGDICLDLLKDKWSPANTIVSTLEAISMLLAYPEAESPLNVDLAVLMRAGDWAAVESVTRWAVREYRAD